MSLRLGQGPKPLLEDSWLETRITTRGKIAVLQRILARGYDSGQFLSTDWNVAGNWQLRRGRVALTQDGLRVRATLTNEGAPGAALG
jgi:hypothetical protein